MKIKHNHITPDMDIETYHTQCTEGVSLSSSSMRALLPELGGCPAKFWAHSSLNKNRIPQEKKQTLDFGRAAHSLVLGEPEFAKHFAISPWDDHRTKAAKEWVEAQEQRGVTIVRKGDFDEIEAMAKAMRRNPQTEAAFAEGKPEVSMFLKVGDVFFKSRPDYMPNDPRSRFILEYKTAVTVEPRKLSQQCFALGYDVQAALTLLVYNGITGDNALGIAHVVQEKKPPYLPALFMFDGEQIEIGKRRIAKAVKIFSDCYEMHLAGQPDEIAWPGYTTAPSFFVTPSWVVNQQEMENTDEYDPDILAAL